MDIQTADLKAEIEKALKSLSEQMGNEIVAKIRPILYTNLDRGRIQGFIEGEIDHVHEYVWKVAEKYIELSLFINNMQSGRATIENEEVTNIWNSLFKRIWSWTYSYLIGKGFYANSATQQIATECANEAAANIWRSYFPYDTDFDRWAHVIVQNICRKYIRKEMQNLVHQSIVETDDALNNLVDPTFQNQERLKDLQGDLLEALAELPKARRQVIELIFLDDLSPLEVAERMNKSIGAIYSLQFNALQDLWKILSEKRNKS